MKKAALQLSPLPDLERLETGFGIDRQWTGYKYFGRKEDIPAGWKIIKECWLVPKVSTVIGKEADAIIREVGHLEDPRQHMPGLLFDWFGQQPAMRLVGDTLWMRFGDDWDDKPSRVDKTIWVPRTLAEYYTATEKTDA